VFAKQTRKPRKSPKVRISTALTVRRCHRPRLLPSFAAIAGVAGVLAAGLIRDNLQAHLALARVDEQPPSSIPTSRRVGGEAPVPASRPVVSSPPPSEPDVRVPPHPALHEHTEWVCFMPAPVGRARSTAARGGWRAERVARSGRLSAGWSTGGDSFAAFVHPDKEFNGRSLSPTSKCGRNRAEDRCSAEA
jgi:hypothetical protein